MTPSLAAARPGPLRHLTLLGSREQALEHLPALDARERLELRAGRISLVAERARLDVRILAETGPAADPDGPPAAAALTLVELRFAGPSEDEADDFVRRYRHRARVAASCH